MIIDKFVEIIVNNQQLKYYRKLGYEPIYRNPLVINTLDLSIGSHYKINVQCDLCSGKTIVEYRQLNGCEKYLCISCAAKNKMKKNYTDEEKKNIVEKIKKTKEIKKENNPNYIENINKKRRKTKKEKYGIETFNNQDKKKCTLKEKYGDENFNNTKKRKETLEKIYGDSCFNNQIKKEQTCLLKYGVRHSNQNLEIMNKIQKSAFKLKYNNNMKLKYRGTYENHFLDFCYDNNINVTEFLDELYYKYDNKIHRYYPDFFHKETNTIIEIKSKYTFECDYDINILKEKCAREKYNFIFIIDKNYNDFLNII